MTQVVTSLDFKEARHSLGLSISEAAALCNVDARTIRRWETGAGKGDGREPHPSACRLMEMQLARKSKSIPSKEAETRK